MSVTATAIAQWFCLHLPSCGPRFESHANHLCFFQFILLILMLEWKKGRKWKWKRGQDRPTYLSKWLFSSESPSLPVFYLSFSLPFFFCASMGGAVSASVTKFLEVIRFLLSSLAARLRGPVTSTPATRARVPWVWQQFQHQWEMNARISPNDKIMCLCM